MKTLYYGDNLPILREQFKDERVDLIYLDPPFNSNVDYNVIFREHTGGTLPTAQILAFEDTWTWTVEAEQALLELPKLNGRLAEFMDFTVRYLDRNSMSAYLVNMAVRLVELHRVLKSSGSLYLHCDSTASHYLKLVLDIIFDARNFRSEIIWKRTNVHSDSKTWSHVSDTIFFYTKSDEFTWNALYEPHSDEYVESKYSHEEPDGRLYTLGDMTSPSPRPNMMYEWKGHASPPKGWRFSRETMEQLDAEGRIWYPTDKSKRPRLKRYLEDSKGRLMGNVWTDIYPINSQAAERLGYPTQKPLALLERIIRASSNPGDIVLDPFCGCGTAVVAAEKLGRRWLGIDVTHLSVALVESRLKAEAGLQPGEDFHVEGTPKSLDAAQFLFDQDAFQFQFWAVGLIGAQPYGATSARKRGKRGGDNGIDGVMYFRTPGGEMLEKCIVSVKGGEHLNPGMVRDLVGVLQREKAAMGVFISLHDVTSGMKQEAAKAGVYEYGGRAYSKVQLMTVAELLTGKKPEVPQGSVNVSLAAKPVKSARKKAKDGEETPLFGKVQE